MVEFAFRTEVIRPVRTVRVMIENQRGQVLVLQKSSKSKKAAGLWELPGGQVDEGDTASTLEQTLIKAGIREVREETGIDLSENPLEEVHRFDYLFEGGRNRWNKRRVHVLRTRLSYTPEVTGIDANVDTADHHGEYAWVSKQRLAMMLAGEILSGNSNNLKPILGEPLDI